MLIAGVVRSIEKVMMVEKMMNIAVFASGNGSNAENLIKYFNTNPDNRIRVALVVTNRASTGVVERATRLGVPVTHIPRDKFADAGYVLDRLDRHDIEAIVLAGFLLMIPDYLLSRYPDRIINIHPRCCPVTAAKACTERTYTAPWSSRATPRPA